jgi:hypothetical protein
MSKLSINRGISPNDGTGDSLYAGAGKINANFDEIYSAIGNGTTLGQVNFTTLRVSGISTLVGLVTVTNDLYVGNNFYVNGISTFIGSVTFRGGTIGLGDSITDNIVFTGEVNSNIIPNLDATYDLGNGSQRWRQGIFSGIVTSNTFSGSEAIITTAGISSGRIDNLYATTGIVTTAGISSARVVNFFATSGIVTTFHATTEYINSANINTGIITNVSGTNLNYTGISTLGNTVVGGATTQLVVGGDARITGILTIGTSSITLNGNSNQIKVGTAVTIDSTGMRISGVSSLTATTIYGDFDGELNAPGKTYYVATNGDDSHTGDNLNQPFATLKYALSVSTSGDTIFVQSGTFTEVFPLTVPVGVTVRGVGLRGTFIQPTTGTRQNDGFLLNGETTVEDLTIGNIYEPGYAFKFANNCKTTTRSPYVQRVTVLNRGSVTSVTDPYGFDTAHSPPTSYKAGRGVLIDGSVVDPTTLEPAMLFNECTFITPNNTALEMTNGARTEWVNCFAYLADKGIYAYDGNVGLASTGYVRIKTSGFSGTTPTANDELYYLEANSQSGTYAQVGTALTITRVGHGLTVGDRIFADFTSGTSIDGFYRVTGYVGVNTFSVTMAGSATTSGNVSYKEALGFGTVRSYTSSTGLSSIRAKGEGLFELPSSRTAKITTAYGNASLSTSQAKFGTASLSLDGVDDYAVIGNYSDFNFGTGDFTIEFWVRPSSIGTQQVILDSRTSSGDTAIYLEINAAGNIRFFTANAYRLTSSVAVTANNWSHVALSRSSGVTRIFVNGTLTPTTYADTNDYSSRSFRIGGTFSGSAFYGGYVDELRISNIARYTSTFTTASGQFNSDGNDKILLHFDGINGSTSFTDSSIPTQDIRWVRSGVGIATATKITLADYQQFGAEMRSIGSAVVFGNTGINASGPGVGLRMFAFNFGHIGSGKDFSQDVSLVNQAAEVVKTNNANVYFVSIDQSGDFRVGDAFYVNQEAGTVNFGGQNFTLNSLSDLNITDGVNTNTITPTTATIGNIQISGNEITSTSGNININPSGTSETNVDGNLNVSGILTASVLQTGALQLGDTSIALDDTGSNGTIRLNTDNVEALRVTNNQRIGIASTAPTSRLDVGGDVKISGVITATTFSGQVNSGVATITTLSGTTATYANANLTTANVTTGNIVTGVVTTLTSTNATLTNINSSGISTLTNLGTQQINVSGLSTFAGITTVTGETLFTKQLSVSGVSTFAGITTVTGQTLFVKQINSAGVITATTFNGNLALGNITGLAANVSTFLATPSSANLASAVTDETGSGSLVFATSPTLVSPILGNASATQINVSGLSTFAGITTHTASLFGTQASFTGVVTAVNGFVGNLTGEVNAVSFDTNPSGVVVAGVATATQFSTGASGTGINITSESITGPSTITIDPAGVGNNTGAVRIKGDLYVDGTQTIINSTTIELADFIVGIASTATTDSLADGAGIKIGPDNTLLYDHTNTSLKSSENFNLASGKIFKINGTDVLSSTTLGSTVVNSSLTTLGTLSVLNVGGNAYVSGVSTFVGVTTFQAAATFQSSINATGSINSSTDVTIDGVSVLTTANDDATALAIALG